MCWRALFSNETGHLSTTCLSELLHNWDTWYQCSILPHLLILQILNILFCSHESSCRAKHCSFGHNSKSTVHGENIGLSALWTFLNPSRMKEYNAILMDCWLQDTLFSILLCSLSQTREKIVYVVWLCGVFLLSRSVAAAVDLVCVFDVRERAVTRINTLATLVDTFSSPAVRKKRTGIAHLY